MTEKDKISPISSQEQVSTSETTKSEGSKRETPHSDNPYSQFVSSVDQFRTEFPAFYKKMVLGLMGNVLSEMRRFNEKIKKAGQRARNS